MQLHEARRHHDQIGHGVRFAHERAERLHGVGDFCGRVQEHVPEEPLGLRSPVPRVVEGLDLRVRVVIPLDVLSEDHGVRAVRVERRIEVDEVHRLGLDVLAEHREVVAIEQSIGRHPTSIPDPLHR